MLFSTPILDMVSVSNNHERGQDPGATLLYKPYTYLPPQRVGFMGRFGGLKTLCPFLFALEWLMIFEETTGAYMYECIYRFQF